MSCRISCSTVFTRVHSVYFFLVNAFAYLTQVCLRKWKWVERSLGGAGVCSNLHNHACSLSLHHKTTSTLSQTQHNRIAHRHTKMSTPDARQAMAYLMGRELLTTDDGSNHSNTHITFPPRPSMPTDDISSDSDVGPEPQRTSARKTPDAKSPQQPVSAGMTAGYHVRIACAPDHARKGQVPDAARNTAGEARLSNALSSCRVEVRSKLTYPAS